MEKLQGKRAVIVEDEGLTQMHLELLLKETGVQVAGRALNGQKGIEVVLKERPDFVLMDITMPGQINGLEATRKILDEFATCILMLTAYSEHREEAFSIGASGYITKPFDSAALPGQLITAYEKWESEQQAK